MDDVLRLLDGLIAADADRWTSEGASWWDAFYADRSKAVPFFVAEPDENLVCYVDRGLLRAGRALDVGCGAGRNAAYLASVGFEVDAVDLSATAVAWAEDRARASGASVRYRVGDVFELVEDLSGSGYDLVYDSGCVHHLPPHRRVSYLRMLDRCLAPQGLFGLSCFAAGEMGTGLPDADLYRVGRLQGGLGYTRESLRWIFSDLTEVELRRMNDEPAGSPRFGKPFMWAALFAREGPE